MSDTTTVQVKLLEAMINNKISYRDIHTWKAYFIPDLYVLPQDRTLHWKIIDKVLENVITSSDAFLAWLILQSIESTFSEEVQIIYVREIL